MSGFGFSAGDFVAGIHLISKVIKALEDSRGAASEYQSLIQELLRLQILSQNLQDIKPDASNLDHVNAVRGMALTFQKPLAEFLEKVEKYKSSLAKDSHVRNSFQGLHRKVQWAIVMPEEIDKLRSMITMKIATTSLLLAIPVGDTLGRIEAASKQNSVALGETKKDISELGASLSKAYQAHEQVVNSVKDALQETRSSYDSSSAKLIDICAGLKTDITQMQQTTTCQFSKLRNKATVASHRNLNHAVMASVSRVTRIYCGQTRRLIYRTLNSFTAISTEVLDYLKRVLNVNLEMYAILMRIQNQIPRRPSQILPDDIDLEDAFGRTRSLQYQYFQHWEVFEAMLRCEYKTLPGDENPIRVEKILMYSSLQYQSITDKQWSLKLYPGMIVRMTMAVLRSGAIDWAAFIILSPRFRKSSSAIQPWPTKPYLYWPVC